MKIESKVTPIKDLLSEGREIIYGHVVHYRITPKAPKAGDITVVTEINEEGTGILVADFKIEAISIRSLITNQSIDGSKFLFYFLKELWREILSNDQIDSILDNILAPEPEVLELVDSYI